MTRRLVRVQTENAIQNEATRQSIVGAADDHHARASAERAEGVVA